MKRNSPALGESWDQYLSNHVSHIMVANDSLKLIFLWTQAIWSHFSKFLPKSRFLGFNLSFHHNILNFSFKCPHGWMESCICQLKFGHQDVRVRHLWESTRNLSPARSLDLNLTLSDMLELAKYHPTVTIKDCEYTQTDVSLCCKYY